MIGAGPTGVTAALDIFNAGLKVVLVHRPGKDPCAVGRAETVHAATLASLKRSGIEISALRQAVSPLEGVTSKWGNGDVFNEVADQRFVITRALFDDCLLAAARMLGVPIVDGAVEAIDNTGGQLTVVLRDGRSLAASFVLDATGRSAKWAHRFGAKENKIDTLTALSATYSAPELKKILVVEAVEDGWFSSVPDLKDGRQVTFFTDRTVIGTSHGRRDLLLARLSETSLLRHLSGQNPHEPPKLWAADLKTLDQSARSNLIAIGDAAQTIDPLSGSGMTAAIHNGRSAANAIIAHRHSGRTLSSLEHSRRAEFENHLRLRAAYYNVENRFAQGRFWTARRTCV